VPKSKVRKKDTYKPVTNVTKKKGVKGAKKVGSGRWVVPTMLALFLIGLAWLVVFYITQGDLPGMRALGNWNILVGFVFIGAGFVTATRWR